MPHFPEYFESLAEQLQELDPLPLLCYWIKERENVRRNKLAGLPRPWTQDYILHEFRFCNVQREDDRVTKWIADHWRYPHSDDPDLWFAMVVARLFNLPTTLEVVGYPVPFEPVSFKERLLSIKQKKPKQNIFNAAYIVSTNGRKMEKIEYLMTQVLQPLWDNRTDIRPTLRDTLSSFHARLMQYDGMGTFMAAQVVADLKYVEPLSNAVDWRIFAASGPGSRRGLNRLLRLKVDNPWRETEWREYLNTYQSEVNLKLKLELHAQDFQNCLCEFDKYSRTLHNRQRPKQSYRQYTGDAYWP